MTIRGKNLPMVINPTKTLCGGHEMLLHRRFPMTIRGKNLPMVINSTKTLCGGHEILPHRRFPMTIRRKNLPMVINSTKTLCGGHVILLHRRFPMTIRGKNLPMVINSTKTLCGGHEMLSLMSLTIFFFHAQSLAFQSIKKPLTQIYNQRLHSYRSCLKLLDHLLFLLYCFSMQHFQQLLTQGKPDRSVVPVRSISCLCH